MEIKGCRFKRYNKAYTTLFHLYTFSKANLHTLFEHLDFCCLILDTVYTGWYILLSPF